MLGRAGTLGLGWLLAATVLCSPVRAAEVIPVRISYRAPAECPEAETFYAALRGRTPLVRRAVEGEPATLLDVSIEVQPRGAVGRLTLQDKEGKRTRRVRGASCAEVLDALGLSAALSLDPEALLRPEPPASTAGPPDAASGGEPATGASSPAQAAPGTPGSAGPPEPEQPDPASSRAAQRLRAGIHGRGVLGQVVSPGLGFGGALLSTLELEGTGLLRLSLGHVRQTEARAAFERSVAGASACIRRRLFPEALSLIPCAVFQGGWLDASGRDLVSSREVRRSFWAAGAELGLQLELGDTWFIEAGGELLVPLVDRRYEVGTIPVEIAATALPTAGAYLGIGFWLGPPAPGAP